MSSLENKQDGGASDVGSFPLFIVVIPGLTTRRVQKDEIKMIDRGLIERR